MTRTSCGKRARRSIDPWREGRRSTRHSPAASCRSPPSTVTTNCTPRCWPRPSERARPDERQPVLLCGGRFSRSGARRSRPARAISSDVRAQDAALYLAEFFTNPAARPRAWAFVTANWTALEPKPDDLQRRREARQRAGLVCDTGTRDSIVTFSRRIHCKAPRRTLDQTIERINNCIELRDRQTKAVGDWLAARP